MSLSCFKRVVVNKSYLNIYINFMTQKEFRIWYSSFGNKAASRPFQNSLTNLKVSRNFNDLLDALFGLKEKKYLI